MLKYSLKLSQGRGWVHKCDTILHKIKGGLNSLVLYLPQDRTDWDGVKDGCLIYNMIPPLPWDTAGEGGDEVELVLFGVGHHDRMYQEIDGGDEGAGREGLKRVNEGLFPVWQLVLVEESSGGSRLHWCWFYWYGEKQHQRILLGFDRGVNEGLAWQILHSVEEKAHCARVTVSTWYWLQVQFPEGPIICCYIRNGDH